MIVSQSRDRMGWIPLSERGAWRARSLTGNLEKEKALAQGFFLGAILTPTHSSSVAVLSLHTSDRSCPHHGTRGLS